MLRTAGFCRNNSRLLVSKFQNRTYAKEINFGESARSSMLAGVETLAKAVSATLGPKVSGHHIACCDYSLLIVG
jgi:chaperonin GroEL